ARAARVGGDRQGRAPARGQRHRVGAARRGTSDGGGGRGHARRGYHRFDRSPATLNNFATMIARREKREPVAYIVGHKEFYSLDFEVSPAVLIPRPESEIVVAAALEFIAGVPDARVLDIGTGSGAIAIAIAV